MIYLTGRGFGLILLAASLGGGLAQNNCRARNFGCWLVPDANPPNGPFGDFHLAFDAIPDGSVSSICGNLANGLGLDHEQEFGAPGCETLSVARAENGVPPPTGNSMVVSTAVSVDIDTAINAFMSTFNRVLECQPTSALVPCLGLGDTMPVGQETPTVDTLGTGLVLAVIGQTFNLHAGGQISMIFYQAVSSGALPLVSLTPELGSAVGSLADQIFNRFQQLPNSNFMVFDAPIGNTSFAAKAVVDLSLFNPKDNRGKNLGHSMTAQEWNIVLFDLFSDAVSFSKNTLAAVYTAEAVGKGQTPDIFVSLVLGIPI